MPPALAITMTAAMSSFEPSPWSLTVLSIDSFIILGSSESMTQRRNANASQRFRLFADLRFGWDAAHSHDSSAT